MNSIMVQMYSFYYLNKLENRKRNTIKFNH